MLFMHMRKTKSKSSTTSSGGEGAKKGFQKTVTFLAVYSISTFAASTGRVRGSLSVDPTTEGKLSITEFTAAVISICMILVFGISKWFNPCSKTRGHDSSVDPTLTSQGTSTKSTNVLSKDVNTSERDLETPEGKSNVKKTKG